MLNFSIISYKKEAYWFAFIWSFCKVILVSNGHSLIYKLDNVYNVCEWIYLVPSLSGTFKIIIQMCI